MSRFFISTTISFACLVKVSRIPIYLMKASAVSSCLDFESVKVQLRLHKRSDGIGNINAKLTMTAR